MSHTEDSSNAGNLGRSLEKARSNPQEDYYRYMLLKEKLGAGGAEILRATSEQDKVEVSILKKLVLVGESTPEFNQLVDLTGSKNRYEQARILAEIVYEKQKAEKILGFYAPGSEEVKGIFTTTDENARSLRSAVASSEAAASRLATAIARAAGGAGGGGA
jgi:hypothetical protein